MAAGGSEELAAGGSEEMVAGSDGCKLEVGTNSQPEIQTRFIPRSNLSV